jgi:hypothetical protein
MTYLKPHLPQNDLLGMRRAWQRGHSSWEALAGRVTGAGAGGTVLTGEMTIVLRTAPQCSQISSVGPIGSLQFGQTEVPLVERVEANELEGLDDANEEAGIAVRTGGTVTVERTAPQFSQISSAGLTGEWHTGQLEVDILLLHNNASLMVGFVR